MKYWLQSHYRAPAFYLEVNCWLDNIITIVPWNGAQSGKKSEFFHEKIMFFNFLYQISFVWVVHLLASVLIMAIFRKGAQPYCLCFSLLFRFSYDVHYFTLMLKILVNHNALLCWFSKWTLFIYLPKYRMLKPELTTWECILKGWLEVVVDKRVMKMEQFLSLDKTTILPSREMAYHTPWVYKVYNALWLTRVLYCS